MKRNYLGTDQTKRFMADLACGKYDDVGIAVTVATSNHDDARIIREIAEHRNLADLVLVSEYDDVSNPRRPTAISDETAKEIVAFLRTSEESKRRYLFVCDGSVSRSAAMLCAWMRVCGDDDLPLWIDARRYSPNTLVYTKLLDACGVRLSERQLNERELLKEMALICKIAGHKAHAMHLLETSWRQVCTGEKLCELRKLDQRADIAVGDLAVFSVIGSPDDIVAASVTGIKRAPSIEELLGDDEVLAASGFRDLEDALTAMQEMYGDEPYPAVGIFLDASDWMHKAGFSNL